MKKQSSKKEKGGKKRESPYLETEGELIQFWAGNPLNDISTGHVLVQPLDNFQGLRELQTQYLCCPYVPTHMQIIEFCDFISAFQRVISRVKVFKSPQPNEYMICIKFSGKGDALDFARQYHRRKFFQIEPDLCIVYQLLAARIKSEKNTSSSSSSGEEAREEPEMMQIDTSSRQVFPKLGDHMRDTLYVKKRLQNPEILFGLGEQATCPICLEPLDSTSPRQLISPRACTAQTQPKMKQEKMRGGEDDFNLTILCCHTFHSKCLTNWNDTTCPLCRYPQSPAESSQCEECGITENLWLCLVCGMIGCFNVQAFQNNTLTGGEDGHEQEDAIVLQGQGHSFDHYKETKHTYAMEIYTHNVWDFCKQNYVHRLIQNQLDGKLIEFADPIDTQSTPIQQQEDSKDQDAAGEVATDITSSGGGIMTDSSQYRNHHRGNYQAAAGGPDKGDFTIDSVHRYNKKIESLNYEYNHMLAQTLENQRAYFERRLAQLNEEEHHIIARTKSQIAEAENRLLDLDSKTEEAHLALSQEKQNFSALKDRFATLLRDQLALEADTKHMRHYNQIREEEIEKELASLQAEIDQSDREIADVKLDRQDMMNHIKMSQKVKKSKNSAEIAQGQTLIFETQPGGKRGQRR